MKNLRWLKILILCSAFLMFLVGCQAGKVTGTSTETQGTEEAKATETEETVSGEPVTITVWADSFFTPEWQGAQGRMLKLIWDKFQQDNNVKIDLELVPYPEFQNKLLQALKAGTAPDAVIADQYWLASMLEVGGVQPLDDLWSEEDRKDFLEWTLNGVTVNGSVYGIWYTTDARVLYYRKDLLEAAGFTEPPKTWDELYDYAKKLNTKDVYGMGMVAGPGEGTTCTLLIDYWSQGGELVNSEGKPVFHEGKNREALINIFNFYKKFFDEGLAPADSINYISENDMNPRIIAGGYAMFFGGGWQIGTIQENLDPETAKQWDIAIRPVAPGGKPTTINGGFMLNVLSSDPVKKEAAWKFIWHLTQPENDTAFAEASRGLPVRKAVWETDKFFSEDYYMQKFAEFLPYGRARDNSVIYPIISDKLSRALGEVIAGQKTPEQAIDDAYKAVTESM